MADKKPELALVKPVSVDAIVALFRKLTGREPSAEDIQKAKAILEKRQN